jgi:hypothetical protein
MMVVVHQERGIRNFPARLNLPVHSLKIHVRAVADQFEGKLFVVPAVYQEHLAESAAPELTHDGQFTGVPDKLLFPVPFGIEV